MNDTTVQAMIMASWWVDRCEKIRNIIISGCDQTTKKQPHQWFLPMAIGVGVN
jgi:hypothetical protein